MARPQVADRGDGLQIWRVAANILNKQSRTASEVVLHLGGLVEGLTTPHRKKRDCYETFRLASHLTTWLHIQSR